MKMREWFFNPRLHCAILFVALLAVTGCSSSDEEGEGLVKFYNGSPNSPAVFLTLDQDLNSDADDEFEQTFPSVSYGNELSNRDVPEGQYFYELAWQDEDSSARDILFRQE